MQVQGQQVQQQGRARTRQGRHHPPHITLCMQSSITLAAWAEATTQRILVCPAPTSELRCRPRLALAWPVGRSITVSRDPVSHAMLALILHSPPRKPRCITHHLRSTLHRWHAFDDSRVSPISQDEVCSPAAYVLFFRRTASLANDPPNLVDALRAQRGSMEVRAWPLLGMASGGSCLLTGRVASLGFGRRRSAAPWR